MSKRIWKQYGDVYWVGSKYHIGSPDSSARGRVGSMGEKALSHLLVHIDQEITYEEIGQVTDSRDPYSLMSGLECQMRQSRNYVLLRRNKKLKLKKRV